VRLLILINALPALVLVVLLLLRPRRVRFTLAVASHKWAVADRLLRLALSLAWRAVTHDLSKFRRDEADGFSSHLPGLKRHAFGSGEYERALSEGGLSRAVSLHYDRNRHHPQHFDGGVRAMTLVDLAEMLADWAAAASASPGGSLAQSMNVNRSRFSLDYAVLLLLENTARAHFREGYDGDRYGEQPPEQA
jgi:hypothetical protein